MVHGYNIGTVALENCPRCMGPTDSHLSSDTRIDYPLTSCSKNKMLTFSIHIQFVCNSASIENLVVQYVHLNTICYCAYLMITKLVVF